MGVVLLSALSYSRETENAKALLLSAHSQIAPHLARSPSNTTISCILSGIEYFILSPSPDTINCTSIIQDAAALTNNASADGRSVISILWSCLATIFACTWVSLHPNIPHPDATEWQLRRRRFLMMICGLIAPEVVVLVALRQWFGARVLVRKMRERFVAEFTMVHGHYMQMGGFMLYSFQGTCLGVITDPKELSRAIQDGRWILPSVDEIMDRSKGDNLSKALAVGQTGWFIAQCVSRLASGLAISQVEVITLALAALNGVMYFLWWNKPLNVRYPVRVVFGHHDGGHVSRREIPNIATTPTSYFYARRHSVGCTTLEPNYDDSESRDHFGPNKDDLENIREWVLKKSPLGWLLKRFSLIPPDTNDGPVNSRNDNPPFATTSLNDQDFDPKNSVAQERRINIALLDSSCELLDTTAATTVAAAIGVLFGALHCLAWDFQFLTPQERTLWRVWSTIITVMPCALCVKSTISYIIWWYGNNVNREAFVRSFGGRWGTFLMRIIVPVNWISMMISMTLTPAYIIGRVGLLVQAFIALRDLQPHERTEIKWVNLLPHL